MLEILFSFLLTAPASAKLETLPYSKIACRDQLRDVLTEWKVTGPWMQRVSENPQQSLFQAATEKVGTWVQIQQGKDQTVFAIRLTANSQLGVKWKPKGCRPQLTTAKHAFFKATGKDDFDDESLKKLLKTHPGGGAILMWSPAMQYSIEAVDHVREAGAKLKIPVELLLDSEVDAKKASLKPGVKSSQNRSFDLVMRGMQIHFPSLIVYFHGQFSSPVLPGLNTEAAYENFMKEHLR